jgi:hypothetical protein
MDPREELGVLPVWIRPLDSSARSLVTILTALQPLLLTQQIQKIWCE